MTSEDIYRYNTRPALKALQLQAEEHLSEFAPLEGSARVRSTRREAFAPDDDKEYRAKGAVRGLELMDTDDEHEI